MPTVPRKTEQSVEPIGIPDIRIRTSAPLTAFGGGPQLNRQTGLIRETVFKALEISETEKARRAAAALQAKQEMDKMLVLDADLQAANLQNETDLSVKTMKGRDSINAMDFITDEWDKGVDVINTNLFNQDQKDAFEIAQQKRFQALRKSTGLHINTELNKYADGLFNSSLRAAQEQLAINYTDPVFRVEMFDKQEALLIDKEKRLGLGEEWLERNLSLARSTSHAGIIERMLFDDEIELADAYQKEFIDEILNDDLAVIRRVKSERKSMVKAKKAEAEREWEKGILMGPLNNIDVRQRLDTDPEYAVTTAKVNLATIASRWNDSRRNMVDKAKKDSDLIALWLDAGGEVDGLTGKFTEEIRTRKQEKLLALRAMAIKNKEFLSKDRVAKVLRATELPEDSATSTKYQMLAQTRREMLQMQILPGITVEAVTETSKAAFAAAVNEKILNVANKILQPNATLAEAQEELEKASDSMNQQKALLPVGTVLNAGQSVTYTPPGADAPITFTAPRTMTIMEWKNGEPQLLPGARKVDKK